MLGGAIVPCSCKYSGTDSPISRFAVGLVVETYIVPTKNHPDHVLGTVNSKPWVAHAPTITGLGSSGGSNFLKLLSLLKTFINDHSKYMEFSPHFMSCLPRPGHVTCSIVFKFGTSFITHHSTLAKPCSWMCEDLCEDWFLNPRLILFV